MRKTGARTRILCDAECIMPSVWKNALCSCNDERTLGADLPERGDRSAAGLVLPCMGAAGRKHPRVRLADPAPGPLRAVGVGQPLSSWGPSVPSARNEQADTGPQSLPRLWWHSKAPSPGEHCWVDVYGTIKRHF